MLNHIPFYSILVGKKLCDNTSTTHSHVLIYGAIEAHSFGEKGCIASNKTIASETGYMVGTVKNVLVDLSKAGWIAIEMDEYNHRKRIIPLGVITIGKQPPVTNNPSSPGDPPVIPQLHPRHPQVTIDNNIDNSIDLSENEFSQEEITDSTCIEKEEDSFAVPEEEYAPRKKSPAPSSPLIVWAEQRIGRKFVSPLKQRRCIITLKGAGYDDEDIKSMWMDLEADEYWANIGIDFGIVLSQADKRSTRVDTKKIKQQYDDHMKEFHRMLAEDLPRDQIQKYVDEFIKPLRAKYGFR